MRLVGKQLLAIVLIGKRSIPIQMVGIFFLFFSLNGHAEVWKARNFWNSKTENQYSQWVQKQVTPAYFKSGKYAGLEVDCADLAYALRAIYAYENLVEYGIHDPTSNGVITEKMRRFDNIRNPDQRFKTFLKYILDLTSTHTLGDDTYPIALTREFVKPGIVFLQKREISGHAEIVQSLTESGVLYFWGATVPPANRTLLLSSSMTIAPLDIYSGLRGWIQPQDLRRPISKLSGYSLEQFKITREPNIWRESLISKLALKTETLREFRARYGQDLCALMLSRVELILEVYEYKNRVKRCLNRQEKEMFSTPGRDTRIKKTLEQLLSKLFSDEKLRVEMIDSINDDLVSCQKIQYFENDTVLATDFLKNLVTHRTTSEPNERVAERWGVTLPNGNPCP